MFSVSLNHDHPSICCQNFIPSHLEGVLAILVGYSSATWYHPVSILIPSMGEWNFLLHPLGVTRNVLSYHVISLVAWADAPCPLVSFAMALRLVVNLNRCSFASGSKTTKLSPNVNNFLTYFNIF